jgi:hypothetical protein
MARLRSHLSVSRNEGYLLDDGAESGDATAFVLFGWTGVVLRFLYRYTLQPLSSKLFGSLNQRRLQRVLKAYPETLICPYCNYLLKRK